MDVTARSFDAEVIEASRHLPVIVDFWAPWCGPCRMLGPILEKLAREFAGRVKVVKVNADENLELSARYGVRSIPDVRAFRDGRPVAQFLGALPESEVRRFIETLLPSPSEEALARAEAFFAEQRYDEAERELDRVAYDPELEPRVEALRQGIAFARAGANETELRARVAANPADLEARFALAGACAARRAWREAMDELLEILRRDRGWKDGEARKRMLAIFNLAKDEPELVADYRRRLASALY